MTSHLKQVVETHTSAERVLQSQVHAASALAGWQAQGWIVSPRELILTGSICAPVAHQLQQKLSHYTAEGFIKESVCFFYQGSAGV